MRVTQPQRLLGEMQGDNTQHSEVSMSTFCSHESKSYITDLLFITKILSGVLIKLLCQNKQS